MRNLFLTTVFLFAAASIIGQIPTTSLQMWYRADMGFTPALWNDQSGNNNHLPPDAFSARPTQETDGSLKFIRCTTSRHIFTQAEMLTTLRKTTGVVWPSGSTGATVFMVFKTTSSGAGLTLFGSQSSIALRTDKFTTRTAENPYTPVPEKQIVTGVFIPNDPVGNQLYQNGELINQVATTGLQAFSSLEQIMVTSGGLGEFDLYELIVYSAPLTDTERETVHSYLAGRYNSALPLTVVSFAARKKEGSILLQWQTTNEFQVDRFEIETAAERQSFIKAGTVKAKNHPAGDTYTFLVVAPQNKFQLFRLKIVNSDETFAYSAVAKIGDNNNNRLLLYPNPVAGQLLFLWERRQEESFFRIINAQGKIVKAGKLPAYENNIPVTELGKGVYWLEITRADRVDRKPFLKQ
ncbi:T9SS type A sorting domain-containing protein [Flavisolibacter sp. BT320]|nr:T9SS type A sorting domain-containing protein [Flavisolibacter longurius]